MEHTLTILITNLLDWLTIPLFFLSTVALCCVRSHDLTPNVLHRLKVHSSSKSNHRITVNITASYLAFASHT